MASLLFLGTSPGEPVADRFFSAALFECDQFKCLIDAGEPVSQRLKAFGISTTEIDAILLTHAHSDHLGGLPMVIQSALLAGRTRELPLFLPEEMIHPLKDWLSALYLPIDKLPFPLAFHPWETGIAFPIGPMRVTPVQGTHLDKIRSRLDPTNTSRFRSYSLRIDAGETALIFSGDIGGVTDLEPLVQSSSDLMVCELSHITPEELVDFVVQHRLPRVAVTHALESSAVRLQELVKDSPHGHPTYLLVVDGDLIRLP